MCDQQSNRKGHEAKKSDALGWVKDLIVLMSGNQQKAGEQYVD